MTLVLPRRARNRAALPAVGAAAVILVLVRILVPVGSSPLPTALTDFTTLAISVIVESMPFVVLGILLSVAIDVWLPAGALERILPRRPIPRRAVISLIGMLLPVCECGNVPLARGLMLRGFSTAEALTFLVAAPIVNPLVIVTTYQAFGFGGGILVVRIVGGYLLANLIGWIVSAHRRPMSLVVPSFAAQCAAGPTSARRGGRAGASLSQFADEAGSMMPALFVGAGVAAAIQVVVPRSVLVSIGSNPLLSVLAMVLLAATISLCSNVDAFFALSFSSSFMPGALTAFLLMGPIVDVKMLALLRTTFRPPVLVLLTVVTLAAALTVGWVMNTLV